MAQSKRRATDGMTLAGIFRDALVRALAIEREASNPDLDAEEWAVRWLRANLALADARDALNWVAKATRSYNRFCEAENGDA